MRDAIARRAARVLLVDGRSRVLLLRGFDPRTPDDRYWFTIGGGLEPGETSLDAAVRELAEETGLKLDPAELTGPVYTDVTEFPFDGNWYRQEQEYFVARVRAWEIDTTGFDTGELVSVDGHRWWTADELDTTSQTYYPVRLAALLRSSLER